MRDALAYEWVRIRTLRSTWWLTGLAVLLAVAISTLMAWAVHHDFATHGTGDLDGLGPIVVTQLAATGEVPSLVAFLLAMIGVLAWGHEYRHGMIRASLTAVPSRTAFWTAKYVVCGAWVVVVSAVAFVLAGLVATVFLHDYLTVLDGHTWGVIGRAVLYALLLTWLGMAFTALTRSQAFALVALFLWPLLVENIVDLFLHLVPGLRDHADLARFLPFKAGGQLLDVLTPGDTTFGTPLDALGGGLVFGGTTVVLAAASYAAFARRDA